MTKNIKHPMINVIVLTVCFFLASVLGACEPPGKKEETKTESTPVPTVEVTGKATKLVLPENVSETMTMPQIYVWCGQDGETLWTLTGLYFTSSDNGGNGVGGGSTTVMVGGCVDGKPRL